MLAAYGEVGQLPMLSQRIRQQGYVEKVDSGKIYDSNRDLSVEIGKRVD